MIRYLGRERKVEKELEEVDVCGVIWISKRYVGFLERSDVLGCVYLEGLWELLRVLLEVVKRERWFLGLDGVGWVEKERIRIRIYLDLWEG